MDDEDWDILLRRIQDRKCTPFLGAGTSYGRLPLGADIAREWAAQYEYPLEDADDLARVAQYLAVRRDPMFPKERIRTYFEAVEPPDFDEPDEPHAVLADFPLPVYLTTNYDDAMVLALRSRGKEPQRELCRWTDRPSVRRVPSVFETPEGFNPTPAQPIVFHLHGCLDLPESLVLTEDDYLDFLVSIAEDRNLIPPRIQEALADASLLFIGYRLRDWDFRVLYRGLVELTDHSGRRLSVTVQLPRKPEAAIQSYLQRYFEEMKVRIYWGTARDFVAELGHRWQAFNGG